MMDRFDHRDAEPTAAEYERLAERTRCENAAEKSQRDLSARAGKIVERIDAMACELGKRRCDMPQTYISSIICDLDDIARELEEL